MEKAGKDSGHYTQDLFRDQIRHIDVVLVAKVDKRPDSEEARSYFLQSVLKVGLQVEVEPGVHENHRNLLFIKIHAPDHVLIEFNDIFGNTKHFRETHIRYVPTVEEQQWITLVRKNYIKPLKLSNAERSLIVYRILLQLPFGEYENFVGINRLIDRYVFSDIYALHDGPYFFSHDDDLSRISARQILFYNWTGLRHLFHKHPINLIREYFGEKIAFYFAFYEYFNRATLIAAIVGICFVIAQTLITVDRPIRYDICFNTNNTYICPKCYAFEVCPFQKLSQFCLQALLNRIFDSPITILYAWFIVLWAFYFVVLWKRKEKFLIWLWEVDSNKFKRTYRPESSMTPKTREKCLRTGLIHNYDVRKRTYIIHILATFLFINLDFYVHMRLALTLMYFIEQKYPMLSVYAIKQVPLFNEYFISWPLRYLTKLGNHRTYIEYYRSFSFKYFLVTFMGAFAMLFYFAWGAGRHYIVPIKTGSDMYYRGFSVYKYSNCGPFTTCTDDVIMLLIGVIMSRYGLARVLAILTTLKTDYKPRKKYSESIPSWEREYRLHTVKEESLIENYNNIALQFGLIILVGAVFPVAPLMVLVTNILHVRWVARDILLCSRRPLLLEDVGTGIWTDVVTVLAYISTMSNALTIAFTTKNDIRNIYLSKFNSMEGFLFYTLTPVETEMYNDGERYPYFKDAIENYNNNLGRFVPKVCYTPGLWTPAREKNEHYYFVQFPYFSKRFEVAYNAEYYEFLTTRGLNIIFFNIGSLFCLNVIQRAMPPFSNDLERIIRLENELENQYYREKHAKDQKAEEEKHRTKMSADN